MKKILLLLIPLLLLAAASVWGEEIYRIRVENTKNGLVQVSLDKGASYYAAGRVTRSAARTRRAFLAADYTQGGCVAATASHGIRIKVSPHSSHKELSPDDMTVFSLVPKELFTEPALYGGIPTGDSGIHTDIAAGTSVFGNHAPFQGSKVYTEENEGLVPLKDSYSPEDGDVIVIIVDKPESSIRYIDFENKAGGSVTAYTADGTASELTKVVRPVKGVGRFDGTAYDAPGQLNTAHGGVITIATSPRAPKGTIETTEHEVRGGFMIQPLFHNNRHDDAVDQVMVVGTVPDAFELEGKAPLYYNTIGLWYYPDKLQSSFRAVVRIDGRDWQEMPAVTGLAADGLTAAKKRNVTHIRLWLPEFDREASLNYLKQSAQVLTDRVLKMGAVPKSDIFTPDIPAELDGAGSYTVLVDGKIKAFGNDVSKLFIDTSSMPKGVHQLQIRAKTGNQIRKVSRYFVK